MTDTKPKRRKLSNGTNTALPMLGHVRGWPAATLLDRLQSCRAMLAIHGFLSEKDSTDMANRIYARAEQEGKELGQWR